MFKRRAEALHRELTELLSDVKLQLVINGDGPPRRGSFEVALAKAPTYKDDERSLLWTGLKNTPRAAKFPDARKLTDNIRLYLDLKSAEAPKEETTVTSLESKEVDEYKPTSSVAAAAQKSKRGRRKK